MTNSHDASVSAAPPEPATYPPAVILRGEASKFRRAVGPVAWMVLEELTLDARTDDSGRLVADLDVRRLAARLGMAKETAARAVKRLRSSGVIRFESHRQMSGRFGRGFYVLDLSGTGLTVLDEPSPCSIPWDTVTDHLSATPTERARPGRRTVKRQTAHASPAPDQLDLFSSHDQTNDDDHHHANPSTQPIDNDHRASHPATPKPATHQPRPPEPPKPTEALAPEVRLLPGTVPVNDGSQRC